MSIKPNSRFTSLRLNTRILLVVGLPIVVILALTTIIVHWTTHRFVEDAIGDQMLVQARIVANLVAIAEKAGSTGVTPAEINRHLMDVAQFAKQKKGYYYEFWITDRTGKVYLGT